MQLQKKVAELVQRLRPFLRSPKSHRKREKEPKLTAQQCIDIMYTPSSSPTASFLGIPRELRLLIYDQVIHLDIDFCMERASPTSTSGYKTLGERRDVACELPINKLALTCHSIAEELRSHARQLPSSQKVACIELRPRALFLYGIYLRRIPCLPKQISTLDLEVELCMPQIRPSVTFLYCRDLWVANKVADLGAAMLHLLHPEDGILKDVTGLKDVRIYLTVTKPDASLLKEAAAALFEEAIHDQAELQLTKSVQPKLGKRELILMWD
jgi:hypothetical protein